MRKTLFATLLAAVIVAASPSPSRAQATTWQIDTAHSAATFSVRHLMISTVRGEFSKLTGVVTLDEKDMTKSSVEVTIDATTINTREPRRDTHLKSADFFDVANHPTMTFRSKQITTAGEGRWKMTGDLTIRGVTKEVAFDVEGPSPPLQMGNAMIRGAAATVKINRKDFGVAWNRTLETGTVVVGDEVTISIDLEFRKQPPAATPGGR